MTSSLEHPQQLLQGALALIPQGRLDEAKSLLKRAESMVRISPQMDAAERQRRMAYGLIGLQVITLLGELLARQGHMLEALGYLQNAVELGAPRTIQALFAKGVSRVRFTSPMPGLKPLLARALKELWHTPDDIAGVAACALVVEPEFAVVQRKLRAQDSPAAILSNPAVQRFMCESLLLELLDAAIVPNEALEQVLTRLRHCLLGFAVTTPSHSEMASVAPMQFCVALANQCFTNDYAYIESPREAELANGLAKRACEDIGTKSINAFELCVLASYRALHLLPCAERLSRTDWPKDIRKLIQRHLYEPMREQELRKTILRQSAIGDPVSVAVRDQYEQNPYPRWISAQSSGERTDLATWLRRNLPTPVPAHVPSGHFDMFVAGCGTGQELVSLASRFQDVAIDAIDLSIASLAFAGRKLSELGIRNVTLAQADILELEAPSRLYDLVVASGVLHHLDNPLQGWRKLADLTKAGGHMLIALYSEAGRQDVAALSAFGRSGMYGTSATELRRFRADIFAHPENENLRNYAINREDFYSLSMLRDMVFHVNERRFTIEKIAAALDELGFEFCGFLVEPELRLEFEKSFGTNSGLSLAAWSKFEAAHPHAFGQMYHFAARKPRSGA